MAKVKLSAIELKNRTGEDRLRHRLEEALWLEEALFQALDEINDEELPVVIDATLLWLVHRFSFYMSASAIRPNIRSALTTSASSATAAPTDATL